MKNLQFILAAVIIFFGLTMAQTAHAASILVTNTNDRGPGRLGMRNYEGNLNNEDDVIEFDPNVFNIPQIIFLTSGFLNIGPDNASGATKSLTINGTGADRLTISGNNQSRVFRTERDTRVIISKMKITGGNSTDGGGISLEGGYVGEGNKNFILSDSIVTGNTAPYGGGIAARGIEVMIINSIISNNTATSTGGGAIYQGNSTQLRIINSTISRNTASSGGGIHNQGGHLHLTNSTIAFNQATSAGGGIFNTSAGPNSDARFNARNSIIAKNTVTNPIHGTDFSGWLNFGEYNIIGNITGGYIIGNPAGNQINVDPQLDPELKINGGVIPTHALGAGSPAIDQGTNCVLNVIAGGGCLEVNMTTDQRGVLRPQDGDGIGAAIVDIGAFEVTRSEVLLAPNAPDLQANSDTGADDSDNVTKSRDLTFDVGGLTNGAIVEFFRNGVKIGETVANGSVLAFSDINLPADGTFLYSVRQTVNNTPSLLSAALLVTVDNTAPTVIINQATGQSDPTRNQPINFTAAFNEAVTGFGSSDVSLAASTANVSAATVAVTGSGATYNVQVGNITADGNVRADVLANAAQDLAGNLSIASTSTDNTVAFDTTAPTVTINQAAGQPDPTRNSTINFTVVFSEPVTGFNAADISFVGTTANLSFATLAITGSGAVYNVALNNISSGGGFVQATVIAAAAADAAGNSSLAATSTDNQITVDNVAPTVTVNQAAGQADPTRILPVNFTVFFSEPVTGFDAADISLTGSTLNTTGATITVTGSGAIYNVAIGNITANSGSIRASVRSGAATDAVGNFSFASTSTDNTIAIDNVAPTVSINQAIGQSDPTSTAPINFTVIFSELVSGFNAEDVLLVGSTANVSAATITVIGNGSVYNVAVGNILSSGQVRASVTVNAAQDAVGNTSNASSSTDNTVTFNARRAAFDFDGDGKADLSVFRPAGGAWYLQQSTAGFTGIAFGLSTDRIVPADYDGDGKTDFAVFRSGTWYLQRSGQGFTGVAFGEATDIPQPADFDGDGRAELAVFRPLNGTWYVFNLVTNQFNSVQFGASSDKPVVSDYDGDGRADYAVYRNGTWYVQRSSLGFTAIVFGEATDKPVVGDYDGDGKTDFAVFRPSNGAWYLLRSNLGFTGAAFGLETDTPSPADYDGDGKTDLAVFRDGTWYIQRSAQGFTGAAFGAASDKPVPNAFVP